MQATKNGQDQYMTSAQFARRIKIHPQTVREWDKKGILRAHHKSPGGRRYYTEEQALAFLNETPEDDPRPAS